jgi:hypothetical protein
MGMYVRDLCAPAELGDQVLDPAGRIPRALAMEYGVVGALGGRQLGRMQHFARLGVQR